MTEKRTLEDVLADLKAAEKEYKEKCLKYGIEEKQKRKKPDEIVDLDNENSQENSDQIEELNNEEKEEETSEN